MDKLNDWLLGAVKSWTVRFNAIVASLFGLIAAPPGSLPDWLPNVTEYLTAAQYKHLVLFILMANLLLRAKTTKPLVER